MHSYETLAILVLALSTALPALSAPVQTPAVLRYDGLSVGASDSSDDANTTPEHILVDGYSQDLNQRAPGFGSLASGLLDKLETTDSFGKVIGNGLLSGVSSGLGAFAAKTLLNDTRRDFVPLLPTKVFDHSIGFLPVIPPGENSTTNLFVPGVQKRAIDVGSTPGHPLDTLVHHIYENSSNNGYLAGRSVRRDPSPLSLSSIEGFGEDLLTALGLGSGGGSFFSRDNALSVSPDERRRDFFDKVKQLQDAIEYDTIH